MQSRANAFGSHVALLSRGVRLLLCLKSLGECCIAPGGSLEACFMLNDCLCRSVVDDREREAELTYHTTGDRSSAASSSLVCPYLALRGFLHPVHVPSTSNPGAESTSFRRHATGLEGHATLDLNNAQLFHAIESINHDSEHRHLSNLPVSGIPEYSMTPFGIGLPRYDSGSQQRFRSYAHHHPLIHRPAPRSGSNLVAPPLGSVPAVVAAAETARGSHMYQRSSVHGSPFPPTTTRRVRPRALTITSFIAATSSGEIGGPHGFSAPGAAMNRSVSDAEGISRPIDRPYNAWGREGFAPFPWIPAEGESHWWGTFNPVQNHAHGGFSRRPAGERMPPQSQSHPENSYQAVPPSQRMPPFL
ncbi:RING/U-box superfamily protein [Zea mays]|uniref:RING/U-box superfamily protein n=1 Tax=Zea mays TaxID=4577 RepID=A0A1D6QIY7_MAIZE|nr:RING/U-box superfamily protein [Zea mays]